MRVAIIGGSVAGLEAAMRLSSRHDVTLFEEHTEIGHPLQCAEGWVRVVIEPYGFVTKVIDTVVVRKLDVEKMVPKSQFRFDAKGAIVMIDRPAMEKYMAELAAKNGCEIVLGRKVTISQLAGDYDLIIDASGHPSQWDREHGIHRRGGVAVQARCKYDGDEMILDFCRELDGYFWVFPKGGGEANVGVGYWRRKKPGLMLREVLEKYIASIGAEPLWYTGGTLGIGLNRPLVRYYAGTPVALVGDAAGMVDFFFGEGMTKAVAAARILADCVNRGALHLYEKKFMERLGRHYVLTRLAYELRRLPFFFELLRLSLPAARIATTGRRRSLSACAP